MIEQIQIIVNDLIEKVNNNELIDMVDFDESIKILKCNLNNYNEKIELWYNDVYYDELIKFGKEINVIEKNINEENKLINFNFNKKNISILK